MTIEDGFFRWSYESQNTFHEGCITFRISYIINLLIIRFRIPEKNILGIETENAQLTFFVLHAALLILDSILEK